MGGLAGVGGCAGGPTSTANQGESFPAPGFWRKGGKARGRRGGQTGWRCAGRARLWAPDRIPSSDRDPWYGRTVQDCTGLYSAVYCTAPDVVAQLRRSRALLQPAARGHGSTLLMGGQQEARSAGTRCAARGGRSAAGGTAARRMRRRVGARGVFPTTRGRTVPPYSSTALYRPRTGGERARDPSRPADDGVGHLRRQHESSIPPRGRPRSGAPSGVGSPADAERAERRRSRVARRALGRAAGSPAAAPMTWAHGGAARPVISAGDAAPGEDGHGRGRANCEGRAAAGLAAPPAAVRVPYQAFFTACAGGATSTKPRALFAGPRRAYSGSVRPWLAGARLRVSAA